jgi:hypothetical protein
MSEVEEWSGLIRFVLRVILQLAIFLRLACHTIAHVDGDCCSLHAVHDCVAGPRAGAASTNGTDLAQHGKAGEHMHVQCLELGGVLV